MTHDIPEQRPTATGTEIAYLLLRPPAVFCDLSSLKMNKDTKDATCELAIQATPTIQDARELNTILVSSIRALFGELEPYSCQVKVKKSEKESDEFVVECPSDSVAAVRSALSMTTPPAYLNSTIYRLDVLRVKTLLHYDDESR
jgi:hypothetical protein